MAKVFLFPDHLHDDRRVNSCTQEAGLCAAPATYGGSNAGRLRLATSGGVLEAATLDVALQTGGNPYGYRLTNNFAGSGAALRWKNSTDGSTSWRGYVDSPYFVRAWIVRASTTAGLVGGMKALPNGKLGVTVDRTSGDGGCVFWAITSEYARESNAIPADDTGVVLDSDVVVLPSGRLVAFFCAKGTATTTDWSSFYSDTNGTSWSLLSAICIDGDLASAQISAQVVDDLIVVVLSTGAVAAQVWTSRDGGCTFEQTGTGSGTPANVRTCVTRSGQILAAQVGTVNTEVLPVIPGGGFGNAVQGNVGEYNQERAIVTRDDGTIWIFSGNTTGSNVADLSCSVSIDDGATFTEAAGAQKVLNLHDTPTANALTGLRACSWRGRIVIFAVTAADSGTSDNVIALEFGEWASVTDRRLNIASNGQPYEHTYVGAVDYPDALGWTRTDAGAGAATVTNTAGALRILCAGTNTYYTASGTFWTGSAGVGKRIRFRIKVEADGSVTQDQAFVRWSISDGVNAQAVTIRFADTGFRVIDGAANILADITEDLTEWTDFFVAFLHDATAAPAGAITVRHRQDADAEGLWTDDLYNGTVAEIGSAATYLDFGGDAAIGVTVDWSIANLQVADDDNGLAELANAAAANPTELAGRPVPASVGMWLGRGLYVSGFNGAGVPGDTATVATTYQYAKENVWRELRPSKQVRSTADNADWAVVFDAGSASVWSARYVAMFGTNVRQATVQFNASDSWGAPSVSQALTVVLSTSSVGAANRGPGYFGPTTSPGWIPHAYKSDGRFHRFFVEVGGSVYEIDDNDADRLYVADVDFSAASGTYYVFGDRGAVDLSSVQRYRFMRLLFPTQRTSDGYYRLGTVFAALGWTPTIPYSHDFVDVTEPNVSLVAAENNLRGSASFGARRHSLQLQWTPINRMHGTHGKTGEEVEALYRALNGAHTPIAFWRDTSDVGTLGVYRVQNTLARPNLRGEGSTAVARVDLLTLSEEL